MNARRKGKALEAKVARMLGVEPTNAPRYVAAPDVPAVTLASGAKLQCEAKKRAAIPAYVRQGLEQCKRYAADAVAVVIIEQDRGEPIACLRFADLIALVGAK